jgi:predicted ATPase
MSDIKPPFVRRVVLRDFKSIRECDATLGPLTLLVGLNGSGKSNFLDALRFVSDALRTNLRNAVEQRGEVRQIVRRGKDECRKFTIDLTVGLSGRREGKFSVTVGEDQGLPTIEEESCSIVSSGANKMGYVVQSGRVEASSFYPAPSSAPEPPRPRIDQLYLPVVSGYPGFGQLYDHLRGMRFFNINPEKIRLEASSLRPESELGWDGQGAASTLQRLLRHNPEIKERIDEYLSSILPVPGGATVSTANTSILSHGSYMTAGNDAPFTGEPRSLHFVLAVGDTIRAFDPCNISDGTLRALGVLLALFQAIDRPENDPTPLVGIEEPEASLHPAAAGVLWDAMNEASHFTQVLATTHSVELLDRKDVGADSLLVVEMVGGESRIGSVDRAGQSIMRDRLATAGELLRQNQLVVEHHAADANSTPALQP